MRSGGRSGRRLFCCAARHTQSLILLVGLFLLPPSLRAESVLNFPRLSFAQDLLTGVAISNPTEKDALLTLTAYGAYGQLVEGPDIRNPIEISVNRREQRSMLTSELFGPGIDATTVGWFQATSSVADLTGFFLYMNGSMTRFDGADLPSSAKETVFNQIRVGPGLSYRTGFSQFAERVGERSPAADLSRFSSHCPGGRGRSQGSG